MNSSITNYWTLPVLAMYFFLCLSANICAQNPQDYPSAETYADTMMQSQEAMELYESFMAQPTDTLSQEEQKTAARMYVETYYKAEWYAAMHQCTYTNDDMCYNGTFELSNQNDSYLEGFCLHDGIRDFDIGNCDYSEVPFIPLPEGVVPDPADAPGPNFFLI